MPPNALAGESSPYLRQHASNPVDWLPWGPEALRRAREQDRPLLVSIGYSSCHWCHVMAEESFEDEEIAASMNASFVCVKVDREERPDIDAIYMDALQSMTGQGGWPLNIFLTPEQDPFYGGTYFPPRPLHGMPAWPQILEAVAEAWQERSPEIRDGARGMRERLAGAAALQPSAQPLDPTALTDALQGLSRSFDRRNGGFGGAPKFPQPTVIELLISEASLQAAHGPDGGPAAEMALHTLEAIASGGIHDLLGGGFHRYAVDATWTVPHFEKMLYDNALLARAFLRAYKLSGRERMLECGVGALDFALRELSTPEGGFCSALDADSGGVEGAFYVWTLAQLREELGAAADVAIAWTGASRRGNFQDPRNPAPGLNVLTDRSPGTRPDPEVARRIRERLLAARQRRVRPQRDEKCLTAWNALMISALAEAGALLCASGAPDAVAQRAPQITGERLLAAAVACAELFTGSRMRDGQGRLLRSWSAGRGSLLGYLEDHAFMVEALISLYEASFDPRWLTEARRLAEEMIARFADPDGGGFFSTASDAQPLIARRKDIDDSPIPSGCASAALGLTRLAALTGEHAYAEHAQASLRLAAEPAGHHPLAFGHMLQALRLHLTPIAEVAIVGPPGAARHALIAVVRASAQPNLVLAVGDGHGGSRGGGHDVSHDGRHGGGHDVSHDGRHGGGHGGSHDVSHGGSHDVSHDVSHDGSGRSLGGGGSSHGGEESAVALLAGRTAIDGRPAAYVCERFACLHPITEPEELRLTLAARAGGAGSHNTPRYRSSSH